MSFTVKALAAAALGLQWCDIMVVIGGYVMATLWLCYGGCYGCCATQERENAYVVSTAACIFFQPLGLSLTYPGISEQSEHQHN